MIAKICGPSLISLARNQHSHGNISFPLFGVILLGCFVSFLCRFVSFSCRFRVVLCRFRVGLCRFCVIFVSFCVSVANLLNLISFISMVVTGLHLINKLPPDMRYPG